MSRPIIIEVAIVILAIILGYSVLSFPSRPISPPPTVTGRVFSDVATATVAPAVTFTPIPSPVAVTPVIATVMPTAKTTSVPISTPLAVSTPTATPATITYTVKSGDTVDGIAQKFGVTIAALTRANNLNDVNQLSLGQRLIIPPK